MEAHVRGVTAINHCVWLQGMEDNLSLINGRLKILNAIKQCHTANYALMIHNNTKKKTNIEKVPLNKHPIANTPKQTPHSKYP